jgi:hypothetical protein
MTRCFARSVVDTHIGDVRRSMGSADFFFLPVVLPFFMVGAVDGVGVAVDASSVAAAGAATGVAFFLFLLCPCGGVRRGIHGGEGREHDDADIDLVSGSLCNVRRRRQPEARSCGGSGDGGGGGSPTFGVGTVSCRPLHLHGVVGLADRVGEIDGASQVFTSCRNRPEGAMLSMDGYPAGSLEGISKSTVNFQMAFFPPGVRPSKTFTTVP